MAHYTANSKLSEAEKCPDSKENRLHDKTLRIQTSSYGKNIVRGQQEVVINFKAEKRTALLCAHCLPYLRLRQSTREFFFENIKYFIGTFPALLGLTSTITYIA